MVGSSRPPCMQQDLGRMLHGDPIDDHKALSGMNWKHARVLLTGRTQDSPCDYRLSWGGRASFNCSEVMMASFKLVQLKFAPRTFVSRKFAPERLAPERSALTRLAVERS